MSAECRGQRSGVNDGFLSGFRILGEVVCDEAAKAVRRNRNAVLVDQANGLDRKALWARSACQDMAAEGMSAAARVIREQVNQGVEVKYFIGPMVRGQAHEGH